MTLFSLKMMISVLNVNTVCFLCAPNIMNKITVFLTRALNCKLFIIRIHIIIISNQKRNVPYIYLFRQRWMSLIYAFQVPHETRACADNFRHPLIVTTLDNALRAAHNPLYKEPLRHLPCMSVNTVFTSGE